MQGRCERQFQPLISCLKKKAGRINSGQLLFLTFENADSAILKPGKASYNAMRLKLILLFVIVLLSSTCLVRGQNSRPMRLEFQVSQNQRPYHVIPIGSKGILLIYRTVDVKTGSKQSWVFSQYDVNLKKGWTQEFVAESEYGLKSEILKAGVLNILFTPIDKKGNNPQYSIISIDVSKGTLSSYTGVIPEKASFSTWEILGQYCLLAYTNGSRQAQFLMVDKKTGQSTTFLPEETGRSIPKMILSDSIKNSFTIVYEWFKEKKASVYCILRCDVNLSILSKNIIDLKSQDRSLNNLRVLQYDSLTTLVLGSYTATSEKDFDKSREGSEENTGLFTALMKDTVILASNFYNFLEFKNYYKRFRANDIIVPKASDKKETSTNYYLNLHEPFLLNKTCVLLMEAYYPEYHTVTNWVYDYYGHMIPTTTTVFDGYRYNNAFLAGVDSTAKLQWSNSMEINNILSLDLSKRINVLRDGENLVLSYSAEGKIASKVISGNETINGLDYAPIELQSTGDKLLSDDDSKMMYWYDNYLVCIGTQEIRNSSKSEPRRTVFYINKIALR